MQGVVCLVTDLVHSLLTHVDKTTLSTCGHRHNRRRVDTINLSNVSGRLVVRSYKNQTVCQCVELDSHCRLLILPPFLYAVVVTSSIKIEGSKFKLQVLPGRHGNIVHTYVVT